MNWKHDDVARAAVCTGSGGKESCGHHPLSNWAFSRTEHHPNCGALRVANRFCTFEQSGGFFKRLRPLSFIEHPLAWGDTRRSENIQCSGCDVQSVLGCGDQGPAVTAQRCKAFELLEGERWNRGNAVPHITCGLRREGICFDCYSERLTDVRDDVRSYVESGRNPGSHQSTNDQIVALPFSSLGQRGPNGDEGCGECSHGDRTVHHNASSVDVHSDRGRWQCDGWFDGRDRSCTRRILAALIGMCDDVQSHYRDTASHGDLSELLQCGPTIHAFPVAFFRERIVARPAEVACAS